MKKVISIFYDIRKDEWRSALLMFVLHFLLMVVLYFLKPARDSLFLIEIGPTELPFVYILLALFSIPVTLLLTKVMRRYPIRRVFIWTLGILAINILAIRWLFQFQMDWVFTLFYIWVGIFGILVISLFWILANAVFKPAQSKRIFSFLTFGAIIGAIVGSEASSLIVSWTTITTENLLYISILLLGMAIAVLYFVKVEHPENEEEASISQSEPTSALSVAKKIIKSRYQIMIAGIVGLAMITTTFTDYQFKALAFESFPEKESLTSFLGTFYAGISLASLAIQMLFSSKIIKRMGLSGAILTRPVGMIVAAVLMAVEPVLATVVLLNGFDGASRYSIDKTGRELLFLPLSQTTKEETKVFIDIFVDRFSRGLGGLLLLGFILVLNWSVYLLTYVVIFLLIAWIILSLKAKKEYVRKFRNSIQKQLISPDSISLNLDEASIYSIIRESLHSDNETQQLHTLFLLENAKIDKITDDITGLLKHKNSQIKLQALKLLQNVDSVDLTDEIRELLSDPDPDIRLETIYYLCQHSSEDPSKVIRSYLSHNDYKLRSAAIGCVSKHVDSSATKLVEPEFFEQLLSEEGKDAIVIKAQLADAFGYLDDDTLAQNYLSKLLNDDHPSVVRKAISGMRRQKNDRFIPQLISKLENPEYRIDAIKALASYSKSHLILYKDRFFDDQLSAEIRKGIPDIFTYFSEQSAIDHLHEMLDISRPDLRYHVLKALNKLKRNRPSLQINETKIRAFIEEESRTYFKLLEIKSLLPSNKPYQILLKALTEKMGEVVERIFRLLGLIYDAKDMYGTYLSLQSISTEKQSAAIEFLDNILIEEDLKYIFPIVDDMQEPQKLEIGRELFNLTLSRYDEGLIELIEGEDIWLKACSIYSVSPNCPANLQDKVEEASHSSIHLIKETAEMVKKRNQNARLN